jgi:hypothetical protein
MKQETNEIWTDMWGFPNYEISSEGNVRNKKTEKVISQRQDGNEYKLISIFYNKKKYTKRVGRLVWQSFNKCECKETIDHLDRNKGNNNLGNLRCVSMKENFTNLGSKQKVNKYNLTPEIKAEIYRNYHAGNITSWGIMKQYGIPMNYIRTTLQRNSWAKYGTDENL